MKKFLMLIVVMMFALAVSASAETVWNLNIGTQDLTGYQGAATENPAAGSTWNTYTAGDFGSGPKTLADSAGDSSAGVTLTVTSDEAPKFATTAITTGDDIFIERVKGKSNLYDVTYTIANLDRSATYDLVIYADWGLAGTDPLEVTQTAGAGLAGTFYVNHGDDTAGGVNAVLTEDTDPLDVHDAALDSNYTRLSGLTTDGSGNLEITMLKANAPFNGFQLVQIQGALPYDPSPADDLSGLSPVAASGSLDLTWTNVDPNTSVDPENVTYVDVWFGTDPGTMTKVVDGQAVSSAVVDASGDGVYYWQVNSYTKGDPAVVDYTLPAEPNVIEGVVWTFTALADAPATVVIDTAAQMTSSGTAVPLSSTVTDDDTSAVTITWEADAVSLADPNLIIDIVGGDTAAPTVTITKDAPLNEVNTVTMTVTVFDGTLIPDTKTVEIAVYDDPCHLARTGLGLFGRHDRNFDCKTDLLDLAAMAEDWLVDYSVTGPLDQ